jgi:hypothetical protein
MRIPVPLSVSTQRVTPRFAGQAKQFSPASEARFVCPKLQHPDYF